MVIDDRLKKVIQERLDSGQYSNLSTLYRDLKSGRLYQGSQAFFGIQFRGVEFRIPDGFGKKKRSTSNGSSLESILENKKAAIKRAKDIKIGYTDIAYFTDVTCLFVQKTIRRYGAMGAKRFEVGRVGKKKNLEHLYYKHAAQVYEQIAAGNPPEEIQKSLNISEQAYTYLVEKRSIIEPQIIATLRIMYNQPTHNVPYVTAELRSHLEDGTN